uniref:Uncharacterized protein n=1 Tax=Candidatus Kentrum sp. LFY TaxID=2126342 RepID=A0A450ULY7_9GAMM|nr:MAG: hypothetical protein BECKLFY1418B_GA0070995_104718 [Candidatus Kentron sp. LFY]
MKKLKTTIIAGVLSMMVVMPALASNTSISSLAAPAQFTEADIQSLFEQQDADSMQSFSLVELTDGDAQALFEEGAEPMELAMLSPEEMEATEGEWVWVIPVIRIGIGLARHGAHHYFRYIGRQPHIQAWIWREGVKNSHRILFRIPLRWR